jgi:hypothetical protein
VLPPWSLTSGGGAEADIRHDPSGAHGGERVLALRVTSVCSSTRAATWVTVPLPDDGGGPAIRFWHRGTEAPNASFGARLVAGGKLVAAVGPEVAPTWTQTTFCVPPTLGGVAARLVFEHEVWGGCDHPVAGDEILLDDIELTTDPSCPVE